MSFKQKLSLESRDLPRCFLVCDLETLRKDGVRAAELLAKAHGPRAPPITQ